MSFDKKYFSRLNNNKIFQSLVISIILISSLTIGMRTYNIPDLLYKTLTWLDNAVTIFFLIEIFIRIKAEEKFWHFFSVRRSGWVWNWFDFMIVMLSIIPLSITESVLIARLLRLPRMMRLIYFVPELRLLVGTLTVALLRVRFVALMMFAIFYIYAILGSLLFDEIDPELWGNVGLSMLTLFRIVTFEDWTDIMYITMEEWPISWLYYVSFIFFNAFVILNIVIAIIINTMEEEKNAPKKQQQIEEQHNKIIDDASEQRQDQLINNLQKMQQQLDHIQRQLEQRKN